MKSNERGEKLQQETALRLVVGLSQLHDTADPTEQLASSQIIVDLGPGKCDSASASVGGPSCSVATSSPASPRR
jgi:hypothetical protein